jgi:hypothetical protein
VSAGKATSGASSAGEPAAEDAVDLPTVEGEEVEVCGWVTVRGQGVKSLQLRAVLTFAGGNIIYIYII